MTSVCVIVNVPVLCVHMFLCMYVCVCVCVCVCPICAYT